MAGNKTFHICYIFSLFGDRAVAMTTDEERACRLPKAEAERFQETDYSSCLSAQTLSPTLLHSRELCSGVVDENSTLTASAGVRVTWLSLRPTPLLESLPARSVFLRPLLQRTRRMIARGNTMKCRLRPSKTRHQRCVVRCRYSVAGPSRLFNTNGGKINAKFMFALFLSRRCTEFLLPSCVPRVRREGYDGDEDGFSSVSLGGIHTQSRRLYNRRDPHTELTCTSHNSYYSSKRQEEKTERVKVPLLRGGRTRHGGLGVTSMARWSPYNVEEDFGMIVTQSSIAVD
ncbi:hypothetical protein BaRGS_00001341, partial [Batillaria attramentaria]